MKGATVDRIVDYELDPAERDTATLLARAFLMGVEGYKVCLETPGAQSFPVNPELCLVAADRLSTLAAYGSVTDIVIRRFIKSRSGRDGTLDRIGGASKDFVMSGYRLRLTEAGEAAILLDLIGLARRSEALVQVRVSGTDVPIPPADFTPDLALVVAGGVGAIARDPLTTILTVARKERLTWQQARYLTCRHYSKPPADENDPFRHYMSLGTFSYDWICCLLVNAGVANERAAVLPPHALASAFVTA